MEQISYYRHKWGNFFKKIKLEYSDDRVRRDVLEKIIQLGIDETGWKEGIKELHGISEVVLDETVNEIREFIKRSGYSSIEEEDIVALEEFKAFQKKWIFDICLLSEFEWYNKYFKNIRDKTGAYSIVAHNGILCGDADFFYNRDIEQNLGTIVLLKDKYRPYLDVDRDGVRGLTLETASEIVIIKNNLQNQGFRISRDLSKLGEANYSYIAMADYCKLLSERNDLVKKLVFSTNMGRLSNESLANRLLNKEEIRYISLPMISNKLYPWQKNDDLYKYLCSAFLREHYLLQIEFGSIENNVFISKKEKELSDDYKKIFPACFFLPEVNQNCAILTSKYNRNRYACNEYHRLSQFILKNGSKLKRYVPGILRELLRILAEDEKDKLVGNVNSLLENLRKFPGGLFEVPDELFISEKDLI